MHVINFTTSALMLVSMVLALNYGNYHAAAASLTALILAAGLGCEQLRKK